MTVRRRHGLVAALALTFLSLPCGAQPTVTSDGTMNTSVSLDAATNTYAIRDGSLSGSNLFHSFGKFGLETGATADFQNSHGVDISNVFGRVTGGEQSGIDGTIRSSIAGANLFLINPAGFVFGPNATLDVTGSFHASSAHHLEFPGGGLFSATTPDGSTFSVAPPVSFGFLDAVGQPQPITVSGTLEVPAGKSLGLIGGDIAIDGGSLRAPSGRVDLASVKSGGAVIPAAADTPDPLSVSGVSSLGRIDLTEGAFVTARGDPAGTIYIRGGELVVKEDSAVNASNTGALDGATTAIDFRVTGLVQVGDGEVAASSFGSGKAGDIRVTAGTLRLLNDPATPGPTGNISSRAFASGDGGSIFITTTGNSVEILNGGGISTFAASSGNTGDIVINTPSLLVSGFDANFSTSIIFASLAGSGNGGDIRITADRIETNLFAGITTFAFFGSSGHAGDIVLSAPEILIGGSSFVSSRVFGLGDAGNLTMTANSIVVDSGFPNTWTFGPGSGGDITITADDLVATNSAEIFTGASWTGPGGNIAVTADRIEVSNQGTINTFTNASGRGGDLTLTADDIVLDAASFPGTSTFSAGDGGDITVAATNVHITNRTLFGAGSTAGGRSGSIDVDVDTLLIDNGGTLTAQAFGTGDGGIIDIDARAITVDGRGQFISIFDSGLSAIATQAGLQGGNAGSIFITSETVEVREAAKISASTFGPGTGGNIFIDAQQVTVTGLDEELRDILLETGADPDALGGRSAIESFTDATFLGDFATGNAGMVSITANVLLVTDQGEIVVRTTTPGNAGAMELSGGSFVVTDGARISASSFNSPAAPVTVVGDAGSVVASFSNISISDGGTVNTGTVNNGAGGNITFTAANALTVTGNGNPGDPTGLFSDTKGTGPGGSISATATNVTIGNGGTFSTTGTGTGDSGDVTVTATNDFTMNNASITTSAALADGGDITIKVANIVRITDSQIATSVGAGLGSGGNINLDPAFVILERATIQANAFGGPGGNIVIVADQFLASPDSVIEASSQLGIDGLVNIDSPDTDVSGALAVLPSGLADATMQLAQQCSARGGRTLATFVGKGRGGLPVGTGEPTPASYFAATAVGDATAAEITAEPPPPEAVRFAAHVRPKTSPGAASQDLMPGTMVLSCAA